MAATLVCGNEPEMLDGPTWNKVRYKKMSKLGRKARGFNIFKEILKNYC